MGFVNLSTRLLAIGGSVPVLPTYRLGTGRRAEN
jgi:hypothetical protein